MSDDHDDLPSLEEAKRRLASHRGLVDRLDPRQLEALKELMHADMLSGTQEHDGAPRFTGKPS